MEKDKVLDKSKIRAHIASQTLSKGAVPSLHVVGLSTVLTDRLMSFLGQYLSIGHPEINVEHAILVFNRDFAPQSPTILLRVVTDGEGNNLPSSTTHGRPQPALVGLLEHKAPNFVEFQLITPASR